jgi:hypothetical protein
MLQYEMRYRDPASTVELLKGLVDDLHSQWHVYPVVVEDIESLHFFDRACLLRKRLASVPRRRWRGIGKRTWDF